MPFLAETFSLLKEALASGEKTFLVEACGEKAVWLRVVDCGVMSKDWGGLKL